MSYKEVCGLVVWAKLRKEQITKVIDEIYTRKIFSSTGTIDRKHGEGYTDSRCVEREKVQEAIDRFRTRNSFRL